MDQKKKALGRGLEQLFNNEILDFDAFENSIVENAKEDDIKEINSIDGVRLTFNDDSWVLVRPSGTEDYIRITLESKDSTKAQAIKETCVKIIKENI